MQCNEVREHLSAYLDKELSAELASAVRAHLETCAECRQLAAELQATSDLLGRLPVLAAPVHTATDVQREIERRLLVQAPEHVESELPERTLPLHRARQWPRVLAVAAMVMLAVGIGVLAYLGQAPPAVTVKLAPTQVAHDMPAATPAPVAGEETLAMARPSTELGEKAAFDVTADEKAERKNEARGLRTAEKPSGGSSAMDDNLVMADGAKARDSYKNGGSDRRDDYAAASKDNVDHAIEGQDLFVSGHGTTNAPVEGKRAQVVHEEPLRLATANDLNFNYDAYLPNLLDPGAPQVYGYRTLTLGDISGTAELQKNLMLGQNATERLVVNNNNNNDYIATNNFAFVENSGALYGITQPSPVVAFDNGGGNQNVWGGGPILSLRPSGVYHYDYVTFSGVISNSGMVKVGNGTLLLRKDAWNRGDEAVDADGRAVIVMNGGTLRTPVNNEILVRQNGNNLVDVEALGRNGTLAKVGGGTLTLSAANSYTGNTTVSDGTLRMNDKDGDGAWAQNNKGITAAGSNYTVQNTYAGGNLVVQNATKTGPGLQDSSGAAVTNSNAVTNLGTFNKSTGGTADLQSLGVNGTVLAGSGTLIMANTAGTVTMNVGSVNQTINDLAGDRVQKSAPPAAEKTKTAESISDVTGSLSKDSGTVTNGTEQEKGLAGASGYSGGTNVSGGTLKLGASNALPTTGAVASNVVPGGGGMGGGGVSFGGTGGIAEINGPMRVDGKDAHPAAKADKSISAQALQEPAAPMPPVPPAPAPAKSLSPTLSVQAAPPPAPLFVLAARPPAPPAVESAPTLGNLSLASRMPADTPAAPSAAPAAAAEAKTSWADRKPDYQLEIRVDSLDEANKSLVSLFANAGWSADRKEAGHGEFRKGGVDTAQKETAPASKYSYYSVASGGGETTWYILTDRDSISRFASRLAQSTQLAVVPGSSTEFQPIAQIQDQLRRDKQPGSLALGGTVTGSGAGGAGGGAANLAEAEKVQTKAPAKTEGKDATSAPIDNTASKIDNLEINGFAGQVATATPTQQAGAAPSAPLAQTQGKGGAADKPAEGFGEVAKARGAAQQAHGLEEAAKPAPTDSEKVLLVIHVRTVAAEAALMHLAAPAAADQAAPAEAAPAKTAPAAK